MTIIGLGLFVWIWAVLPYIFQIMPNTDVMEEGEYVVFFLGLALVWDMMTGVNGEIIMYSKYYRFNLYLTLFLALVNILGNLYLIREYGITGAAMATCFSFFLFNLVKLLFVKIKFGFQPLSYMLIPVVAFSIGSLFISRWLPDTESSWINLFYKGAVFIGLYGFTIWRFRISSDINDWLERSYKKIINVNRSAS